MKQNTARSEQIDVTAERGYFQSKVGRHSRFQAGIHLQTQAHTRLIIFRVDLFFPRASIETASKNPKPSGKPSAARNYYYTLWRFFLHGLTHKGAYRRKPRHVHAHLSIDTYSPSHTCIHIHANTFKQAHARTHACTHTRAPVKNSYSLTNIHTHTHVYIYIRRQKDR